MILDNFVVLLLFDHSRIFSGIFPIVLKGRDSTGRFPSIWRHPWVLLKKHIFFVLPKDHQHSAKKMINHLELSHLFYRLIFKLFFLSKKILEEQNQNTLIQINVSSKSTSLDFAQSRFRFFFSLINRIFSVTLDILSQNAINNRWSCLNSPAIALTTSTIQTEFTTPFKSVKREDVAASRKLIWMQPNTWRPPRCTAIGSCNCHCQSFITKRKKYRCQFRPPWIFSCAIRDLFLSEKEKDGKNKQWTEDQR